MKKILVLSHFDPKNTEHSGLFAKHALPDQKVTVRGLRRFFVAWDGKHLHIENPTDHEDLSGFDGLYIVGWRVDDQLGLVIARWLDKHKIPFVGRTALDLYPNSKIGEMTYLLEAGVPYPKTFYASKPEHQEELYNWAHKKFGLTFPVIVKAIDASMGNNNFLVRDLAELKSLPLIKKKRYMMQEFVPNSCDYRLIIIGGEIRLIMRRSRLNNDSHVNNTSKGAKADFIPIDSFPKEALKIAVKAAKSLGRLDISGVDIVIDEETGQIYVLEVNKTPNIALGSTEVNVAQKLGTLYAYLNDLMRTSGKS